MTADQLALEPVPYTHPIVNGRILLPGHGFSARNRISGQVHTYQYTGTTRLSPSDELWVEAKDRRGNARTIAVDAITHIKKAAK